MEGRLPTDGESTVQAADEVDNDTNDTNSESADVPQSVATPYDFSEDSHLDNRGADEDARAYESTEGAGDAAKGTRVQRSFNSSGTIPSKECIELSKKESLQITQKPGYKHVVNYIKAILEELVNTNTENVMSHFEEWSSRTVRHLENTYGTPITNYAPAAENHLKYIRSFTNNWRDSIQEYAAELGVDTEEQEAGKDAKLDAENAGEGGRQLKDGKLNDDDWDETNYDYFQDTTVETKEPPFDEFQLVTLDQIEFFNEIGVGIPKYEQYEIHMALLRMAKVRNLEEVRFWGKIFGLYQNYYVAEAVMTPDDMKVDDFDDLPSYIDSDLVGEYDGGSFSKDNEVTIEEEETEPSPIDFGEFNPEFTSEEEKLRKPYGDYFGEGGEEELQQIYTTFQTPSAVKFESLEDSDFIEAEKQGGEEVLEVQESQFELDVNFGPYAGKQTLKTYKLPVLPVTSHKPKKLPPMEEPGVGTNKYVYFVTNNPMTEWIRLPHVIPEQIVVARKIRKFFTGHLTSRVISYPKFPGLEIHLLRAQIARISAGTQVSPAGYYRFDEGEESADAFDTAAGQSGRMLLNRDFEPVPVKDLTDQVCSLWVHHTAHILEQGRAVWYNVNQKEKIKKLNEEGEVDDEESEEEAPIDKEIGREKGPPLLTSCAEDVFIDSVPPWTARPALELTPEESCVFISSNLWPGSYSFAFGRKVGFLYHGWGVKAVSNYFMPPFLDECATEYPLGPEIIEITDPDPKDEEDFRLKVLEFEQSKLKPLEIEGESFAMSDDEGSVDDVDD